jgi:PAS domain S-box-containing protein
MNQPPSRNPSPSLPNSATPVSHDKEKPVDCNARHRAAAGDNASELRAINARLEAEIAERVKIEEALRKSDERYRVLIETVPVVIYSIDLQTGAIAFLNLEFEAATGWRREDWLGKPFLEIVHPDDRQKAMAGFQNACQKLPAHRHELRILCNDGHYSTGEFLRMPKMHNGQIVGEMGIARDITERKEAEIAQRENERLLKTIFNGICDPAWMKTTEGVFLAVNRAWCAFVGKEEAEALGKKDSELFDSEVLKKIHQQDALVISSGKPLRVEELLPTHQGDAWFDTVITPIPDPQGRIAGVIGIARDITERKQMEEKFLRSQRMESIGALAGGIAHDLNNILGPIMMSASMLRETHSQDTRNELISAIQEATQRGADIVRQVLTYTRGTKSERKPLNTRTLVVQVERILREILSKSITLNTSLSQDLWNITGNPTQLQQVLVNLCVNARDAMPHGGLLSLQARNCEIKPPAADPNAAPRRFVKIEVIDTGIGISREIMGKIFEPFFTTKEPGKGTGLGLSTVQGIIKSHGGFITVDSEIGQGSKFSVHLPATSQTILLPAPSTKPRPDATPKGQGQKVLVVDDELPICKMVETILNSKGYHTLTSLSAHEALDLYAKQGSDIQAILTDVAMPDMDGVALTRKLKTINPAAVIIASTGQPLELRQRELEAMGVHHFLAKPYNAHQLLEIVQQALASG